MCIKFYKASSFVLGGIFVLFSLHAQAQAGYDLKGQVKDSKGETLPGINVIVDGTIRGTVTGLDGTFSIHLLGDESITISGIGYISQKKQLKNESFLEFILKEDEQVLGEVLVVAYGTTERKSLTGSITKVDPKEVSQIAVGSLDAQLQGKVAGVQISSSTGIPGETSNVRVRGVTSINADNDPLYVIDGVFINSSSLQTVSTGGKASSPIADINPNDIESIEVLKDAEASALYGSRGANGVILVTTKRGTYNQKPKIQFNTSHGQTEALKLWDLTTGPEHATLVNEWWINTGQDNPSLNRTSANRPYRPVSEGGRGLPEEQQTYDRLGELFRVGQVHNYDLSISGGSNSTRYFFGGGFTSQDAIIKPIEFNRGSFRFNLDQDLSDRLRIGINNSLSRTFRNQGRAGDGPRGGLLQAALHTPTVSSPTNGEGELVGRAGFDNLTLLINNYDVSSVSLRYIGNLYAEYEITPDLKFKTSIGADYNNYDESEYWNTFLIEGGNGGLGTSSIGQMTSLINEQVLSYKKAVSQDHTIGFLLGNTLQSETYSRTYAEGRGFPNNEFKMISAAATTFASQSWTRSTLVSFFSRADYSFKHKLLIDLSLRADGSSKFGSSNKWGYFPAVGAAWRLKEEKFLKESDLVSDLKIKGSYGILGNQNGIGNFASQGLWSGGSSYQNAPGIAPQQLGNEGLKWERTRQINFGVELGLFNDRLGVELNLYDKYTSDALLRLPLPGTTGFSSYWSNSAEISNKGVELDLTGVILEKGGLSWSAGFNIASNKNRIEKLASPLRYGSRDLILLQEGSPMYSFWVYNQLYVDPQTGNAVYEDVNADGKITVDDRKIVGDLWPDFFGGLTSRLAYKGFDLDVFFAFQEGNLIYNHNAFFGGAGGARDEARIIFADNLRRWQKPGDITDVPRSDGININNYRDGTGRFLEDGSFIRLRSLNLGYTLPTSVVDKVNIERVRFFFSGTNLFLWTKYSGADPEASSSSDQNSQGIDLGTPPQPRTLQLGVNITL
jgi:TonB-linked SusC/RagA family outer membrane protein